MSALLFHSVKTAVSKLVPSKNRHPGATRTGAAALGAGAGAATVDTVGAGAGLGADAGLGCCPAFTVKRHASLLVRR